MHLSVAAAALGFIVVLVGCGSTASPTTKVVVETQTVTVTDTSSEDASTDGTPPRLPYLRAQAPTPVPRPTQPPSYMVGPTDRYGGHQMYGSDGSIVNCYAPRIQGGSGYCDPAIGGR
jgi:hypothetical protein